MEGFTDNRRTQAAFEQAIGKLALSWARTEAYLANLLNVIVAGGDTSRGRTLYYSVSNISPRLQVIDQLIRDLPYESTRFAPVVPRWRKLKEAIEAEARDRRNPVIHGQLVSNYAADTMIISNRIVPSFGSRTKQPAAGGEDGTFGVDDILAGVEAATQLGHAAQGLGDLIAALDHGRQDPQAETFFEERLAKAKALRMPTRVKAREE